MKILFIGARLFDDVAFYLEDKKIESIVTESNKDSPNLELPDKHYIVPRGMEKPMEIAIKEKVDGVIPLIGIDDPLMDVAIFKEELETKYNIPVIASNKGTINISSDKIKTKEFFKANDILTPNFQIAENPNQINLNFPIVLKQKAGQGGRDIAIAKNQKDVNSYFSKFNTALVEEFIEGSEISIEVLCFNNSYLPLVPVYKGETTLEGTHPLNKIRSAPCEIEGLNNKEIIAIAYKIANFLKAEGIIDIDFIFSKKYKKLYAIEINTRPSGTRYLTAASSGIHPLNKLVDMVIKKEEFDFNELKEELNNYFALEIPIGNYEGPLKDKPLKKFIKNSWVVHGPKGYERITISGENKEKIEEIAKKTISQEKFKSIKNNQV
ncbi:MAG: ATP-grasp domain-containing protein [Methanobrevibacter sp.]|jgi:carbamoylphosphate synthase large subunit|nr:ATP-grasp domain-containing protein [Methanobrevibacter sp.]